MKKYLIIFAALFLVCTTAAAAEILIEPASGSYVVGDVVEMEVNLSSPDQPVNAVSFVVSYPTDSLKFLSLDKNTELVSFWIETDRNHSDGSITLEGLLIDQGFQGQKENLAKARFQVLKDGKANIFLSEGAVHAYDGLGTNVLNFSSDSVLTFVGSKSDGGQNIITDIVTEEEPTPALPLWALATIIVLGILLLLVLIGLIRSKKKSMQFESESDKEMFKIFMKQLKNKQK